MFKSKKFIKTLLLGVCAAAVFVCGIFAIYNTKGSGQTVTVHAATEITPTIYWGVDSDTGVLTLSTSPVGGIKSGQFSGTQSFNWNTLPWKAANVHEKITSVIVADPISLGRVSYLFAYLSNVKVIDVSNLDTSNVTSMEAVFHNNPNLETIIGLENFDTKQVTDMQYMFYNCQSLHSLDVSNFDTSKVTNMMRMFDSVGTYSLDLSNFDCSNVTNFQGFLATSTVKELTVNNSLASHITDMSLLDLNSKWYGEDGTEYTVKNPMTVGGTYTKYVPHIHDYKLTATIEAATCTTDGSAEYTCAVENCGKTKTETIPATGHKPGAASCTEEQICTVCGEKLADAGAHTPGPAATCTAPQICTVCKTELVAAKGHTEVVDEAVAPTCTENGKTEGKHCSVCNTVLKAQTEIPANGHSWNDGEITTYPTCKADGVKTFACTVCNITRTETVDKIAHTPVADAAIDPTCTTAGKTAGSHCSVCNEVLTAQTVIPALGHDYKSVDGGTPPTCTTPGSGKVKCSRCGDEKEGDSIPALGHKEVTDEAVAPTCTETGLTEGKHCATCNQVLVAQTEVPALGHDWTSEWCKDKTNHWHECTVCGEKKDDEAHAFEWVITKQPTVDETGLKQNICSICGEIDGEEVIAKLVEDPDGNGNVSDLPPDNDYELEIAVKESDSLYNIAGVNKGFKVELFVVDGDDREPYDATKTVTLTLVVPEGMEEFTLYIRHGDVLDPVAPDSYTVNDRIVTIRTTLPNEFVFNSPLTEEPEESSGIPWWVWLIVGLGGATLVTIIIVAVVLAKKKGNGGGNGGTSYDDAALRAKLAEQDKKLDKIIEITDGGFNDIVDDE